uniref:IgA FC receptor n=1 Tax=Angiostrongylus cantonensis TaxID=6313 RepID=A0A0K0CZW5_ANGCA
MGGESPAVELPSEEYPTIGETVTVIPVYEEKPEHIEHDERRYEAESPVVTQRPVAEIPSEGYPIIRETFTATPVFEENPEYVEFEERRYDAESPMAAESPAVELPSEEYPAIRETVTVTPVYEEKLEHVEYEESRYEAESPMAAESIAVEVPSEEYPAIGETVTVTPVFEGKPEYVENEERRYEAESPMAAESPSVEVPSEEYPAIRETVTVTTVYEEKPEHIVFEERRYDVEPPTVVESPIMEVSPAEYPRIMEAFTATPLFKEYPEHIEYEERKYEAESPKTTDSPFRQVSHEEQPIGQESVFLGVPFEEERDISGKDDAARLEGPQIFEEEGASLGKLAGFAAKAANVAGVAVVAPVALASVEAVTAYEAMTRGDGRSPDKGDDELRKFSERLLLESSAERYTDVAEPVSTTAFYEEKPEPIGYEEKYEAESPMVAVTSVVEVSPKGYTTVTEAVSTTVFCRGPEELKHIETRYYAESPAIAEKLFAGQFPEGYPTITDGETSTLLHEEKADHMKYVEKGETELPIVVESPVREVDYEKYPTTIEISEVVEVAEVFMGDDNKTTPTKSGKILASPREHLGYTELRVDEGLYIIQSQSYDVEVERRSLSSPTKTEQRMPDGDDFIDHHDEVIPMTSDHEMAHHEDQSVYTYTGAEKDVHLIELKDYGFESERHSLSSPSMTEEHIREREHPTDYHSNIIPMISDHELAVHGKDLFYTAADNDMPIVESKDHDVEFERHAVSSPTMTEQHMRDDESPADHHIRTASTIEDRKVAADEEDLVYTAADEGVHIIESKSYDIVFDRHLLSFPTKNEQYPCEHEGPIEGHTIAATLSNIEDVQEKHSDYTALEKYEIIPVKESGDYIIDHGRKQLSLSPEQKVLDFGKDDYSQDPHVSKKATPVHLLEGALENVVKLRFTDVDELESPERQSLQAPSSFPDEQQLIAGDEDWKVYDNKGEILEEFSLQLTQELIFGAESNASRQCSKSVSESMKQDSFNDVIMEHEVGYQSDLREKLDILAGESREELYSVSEGGQLDVIDEGQYKEKRSVDDHEIEKAAFHLADDALKAALEPHEDAKTLTSTSESNVYHTATEHSKDEQYESCVTSQGTYDSAQEWTSQESDYSTATSGATSRLSGAEERQGSVTPLAVLSPVDSDRQFTANQDFDDVVPVIRHFGINDTARSTPDVALQMTIEEEEEEIENVLPTNPSGVLLLPHADPGRPSSPVPPSQEADEDDSFFVFLEKPEEKGISRKLDEEKTKEKRSVEWESTSSSRGERSYSRQYSDLSSESRADTVIHHEKEDAETVVDVEEFAPARDPNSDFAESLDKISIRSGAISDVSSQRSSELVAQSGDGQEEPPETQLTENSPSSEDSSKGRVSDSEEGFVICPAMDEAPIEGELETVEEEPEDVESISGSGNSSVGVPSDTLALIGKYKHVSSDNVSLTSLQEFERLEQVVANRGEGSLSSSEIELYAAGKLRSTEGSVSSLTEFEKLEQEIAANISPQEDVTMLPDIREESEVEDMSTRDDDEDEHSETEVKTRPIDEEDLQAVTPLASPIDSLEREPIRATLPLLETSTDSLEPSYQEIESHVVQRESDVSSLAEYEVGTYQEHDDDDKDSLECDMDTMLRDYPTTLTTFETTAIRPDGTVQTISRRVETRVRDPVMSHVTFTGTESEERVLNLPVEEQFETVDAEGNITRTVCRRQSPPQP